MKREGWREVRLENIAEPYKSIWKVGDAKMPYIALEHIKENSLCLNSIGNSDSVASNKYRFSAGDTLFGKLRPYFRKVVKPDFDGICSTDIWVIREKNRVDKDFIFYFFANPTLVNISSSTSDGTRMPRADWRFLSQTTWNIPPLPEQKAIAEVLSSLDDKIDLLHRQNKTLENMAQTLFRQWFIKGENAESKTGVISDEFDITMGQSPLGSSYNEEGKGIPMFQGNADFGFRFPQNRIYTTDPKKFAKKFDTLVSIRAPVGEQNMAKEQCCIGRGIASFRYKHNSNYYTYTYFKIKSLINKIKKFNHEGTVFGSIGKKDFEEMKTSIPKKELLEKFEHIAKPINDRVIENCNQINTVKNLRDTLLPKLMNGEVRTRK